MKKILLILLTCFTFSAQSAIIDECKIDFYYGNGVWNDLKDAQDGQKYLKMFLKEKLGIKTKIERAFNHTHGTRADLIETFYQLAVNKQISFGYFYFLANAMIPEMPEPLVSLYLQGMVQEEAEDVFVMTRNYKEAINAGHRVLLVSHSQGNLFGLRSFNSLEGWQKGYFRQVSVATPADKVANSGDWITDTGDIVIKKLIDTAIIGENSLLANATNTNSSDISGHLFVDTYLMGDKTSIMIKSAIENMYEKSQNAPSQWQTDRESDPNTCDYRITVKHRFDPAIEMSEDVYPFAPAKKLYQVNGEWVKASCGGKTIMGEDHDIPTWDGKKANECYMIDNPPKEKIATKEECVFEVALNDGDYTCYNEDTLYTVANTANYGAYTFHIQYDDTNTSWTACRHCTNGWTNSHGDRLEIGNGAGGQWVHGGINLFVDVLE